MGLINYCGKSIASDGFAEKIISPLLVCFLTNFFKALFRNLHHVKPKLADLHII